MCKFYFKHRNVGNEPDKSKYYFSSIDELINQVHILKDISNDDGFIQWSISECTFNENVFHLMSEYWTTETRGTDEPLKCKGWFVYGYIHNDETDLDVYDIFPKWVADKRNHFIEKQYMGSVDFSKLSEVDIERVRVDGGLILDKFDFGDKFNF